MASGKVVSNFLWRFMERIGARLVSFVVSIILARLLLPSDYGTVALVYVFIAIFDIFVNAGLGSALIQKKDADDTDFSTVFFANICFCFILYFMCFALAPAISRFYSKPELTPMLRVCGIMLLISGVKNVQTAYVSKTMQFKRFFFATLGGTLFSAVVGIVMAYQGYGAWALIAQNLTNHAIDTIILWITVKWRPRRSFSIKRLKGLFSFGWKILAAAVINAIYNRLRTLIIGKVYTSDDLAYYNRGNHWPNLIVENANTAFDSVLFPSLSNVQDDIDQAKRMTKRAIVVSSYVIMPLMVGLAVCAVPVVRLILTDKWLPSVYFMRVFCAAYAFYPIHTANINAIKAMGRSDLILKLEVIKKVLGILAVAATMFVSVKAMALSLLFISLAELIINSWPNSKLLGYGFWEQMKDLFPQALLAMVMGLLIYCVSFAGFKEIVTLMIQVALGIFVYVSGSVMFRIESFYYCKKTVLALLKK